MFFDDSPLRRSKNLGTVLISLAGLSYHRDCLDMGEKEVELCSQQWMTVYGERWPDVPESAAGELGHLLERPIVEHHQTKPKDAQPSSDLHTNATHGGIAEPLNAFRLSRYWGPVSSALVQGRVYMKAKPQGVLAGSEAEQRMKPLESI